MKSGHTGINGMPSKVNYFTWRAALGRIPVKHELMKRGIQINNQMCPKCDSYEESVAHLISGCTMSKLVWWNILTWLKLPVSAGFCSCAEALVYANGLAGLRDWKKLLMQFSKLLCGTCGRQETRKYTMVLRVPDTIS
ncbi:putative reverse transcriptase zinc-binding domain-containing protein [Helianthus annuus]|nr:putative reverse transcriptase zinc-binding domain-containing protein [Helianthus annuus]